MNIVGCGNASHNGWWKSHGAINGFCGLCGRAISQAPPTPPKKKVKIQITQTKNHELNVFTCYASYKEDDTMHFINAFTDPQCAVEHAKAKAIRYHFRGTQFEWEVWLDTPVTTRNNRRMAPWETIEA